MTFKLHDVIIEAYPDSFTIEYTSDMCVDADGLIEFHYDPWMNRVKYGDMYVVIDVDEEIKEMTVRSLSNGPSLCISNSNNNMRLIFRP